MNTKSIRVITLFAMLALATAACGSLTAQPAAPASVVRSITVLGFGEAEGRPDQANVQVGVETFAETVSDANGENEAVIRRVMAALSEEGVVAEDIQTSNFSIWAEQNYDEFGPAGIVGYRVTNQVNVTIRDIDNVGGVLEAAIDAGANSIYGVFFSISDSAALESEARAAAMNNARERAQTLAELSGVQLGEVLLVSEIIGQPIPVASVRDAEFAGAAPSISPGQLNYSVQIQVTFAIAE